MKHDEFYREAIEMCRERGEVSTNQIQKHFHISYSRAIRMVRQMEEDGYCAVGGGSTRVRAIINEHKPLPAVVLKPERAGARKLPDRSGEIPPSLRRDKKIYITVTGVENQLIREMAAAEDMTVGDYLVTSAFAMAGRGDLIEFKKDCDRMYERDLYLRRTKALREWHAENRKKLVFSDQNVLGEDLSKEHWGEEG